MVKPLLLVSSLVLSFFFFGATDAQSAPQLPRREVAHYRVTYGLFGQVGELTLSLIPARSAPALRSVGVGSGSILGMGDMARRIESDFDVTSLIAKRWTSTRSVGGATVVDTAQQATAGKMAIVRRRAGQPDRVEAFARATAVLDPIALLVRLRVAPPTSAQRLEVLDGRFLWAITVAPSATPDPTGAIKLEGRADPIFWGGSPDPKRKPRTFTLWLANDGDRTPLKLVMPYGPSEIRADLVSVSNPKRRAAIPWQFTPAALEGVLSSVASSLRLPPASP